MLRTDDYECTKCGLVFEEMTEKSSTENVPCRSCEGKTTRLIGAPCLDWAHMGTDPGFPGAYAKWAKAKTDHHRNGKDSLRDGKGTSLLMH